MCSHRVSPPVPTWCNPVALGINPRESVSNLGLQTKFRIFIVYNAKFEGPPFEPSTSAQLAGSASVLISASTLKPTRCYPVALGLKPQESVSNLGPPGQISCFISNRHQSSGICRSSPRSRPNWREVQVCSQGCPL